MRLFAIALLHVSCFAVAVNQVRGDDLKINTPVVSSSLKGRWELQPEGVGTYKQTLGLQPQFFGEWRQSEETLPVSIAWFVEGGELRILHYYEPDVTANYRVKTLIVPYKLSSDTLTLTFDGKKTTWKRIKESAQPNRSPQ